MQFLVLIVTAGYVPCFTSCNIALVAQRRLHFYGTNQVTILVWKRPNVDILIVRQ